MLVFMVWIGSIGIIGSAFADQIITKEVNWRAPAGGQIREIRFRIQEEDASSPESISTKALPISMSTNVIDSPPIDGFVPWIAITTTNESLYESSILDAIPEPSVIGQLTASDPQSDFAVGIFDTGASAHVFSHSAAVELGIYNPTYLTDNDIMISGVTGEVFAWVSYPLGVFIGGINILDPNETPDQEAKLIDTSAMKGESNVCILVGQDPGSNPDLVTAIGSPLSVYFTTSIRNDQPVTVVHHTEQYIGPTIDLYDLDDENAPTYPNKVPLELRPLGSIAVQYIPFDFEDLFYDIESILELVDLDFSPSSPSVLIGNLSQSLFFVNAVDLTEGTRAAVDKNRFMLDTGAQITVIGSRVAARLGLDPQQWEFQVPITGVTGESIDAPGFYLDTLAIPALGEWLEFTNVPVVLLDISSPEGGTLDGVIGMNLFTQYNLILRGGGMFLGDDPVLEFQRIASELTGDIAPDPRDGQVNMVDFDAFSAAWMSQDGQPNWNVLADLAASGQIDLADLVVLAGQWLATSGE